MPCFPYYRKRHSKEAKDEIEASVTCSQFITDNTQHKDAFASPDTVCKFCGEDFRYFRALKHHLRCHSSCRYKPFMCKLCSMGFSIKANCMRHIQKHHVSIEHNQIEQHIQVNDSVGIFQTAEDERMMDCEQGILSSTPISRPMWNRNQPLESPISTFDVVDPIHKRQYPTYITSPPVPVLTKVKVECGDSGFDQPLDFSMKATKQEKITSPSLDPKLATDEVPIDLSVRKSDCKYPAASYPAGDAKRASHLLHSTACLPYLDVSNPAYRHTKLPLAPKNLAPPQSSMSNLINRFNYYNIRLTQQLNHVYFNQEWKW